MRLQKFLSRAGVASRRKAEEIILEGRVQVNGVVVTELGTRIDTDQDRVQVDGKAVAIAGVRWLVLNKPIRVLTTRDDPRERKTVYELLDRGDGQLPYVGRLDWDTAGLLLFSNDGDVVHRLMHPSYQVERVYEVETEVPVTDESIDSLREGVRLDDGPARAERVRRLRGEGHRIEVVLLEGRNREVRRMLEAVGHPVVRLRRTRYGPISLRGLPEGLWRMLSGAEVNEIRRLVGLGENANEG